METAAIVEELRELIIRSAPDPSQASKVRACRDDEFLDRIIPFSSLILLGVVVAVEDRYSIRVTRESLARSCTEGTTLRTLAQMIQSLQAEKLAASEQVEATARR